MRGPIDYIIVGFEGNNFSGEILEELKKASDNKTIAVLAVALVARDKDGNVAAVEISDPDVVKMLKTLGTDDSLIDDEDVEEVGGLLEDDSAAGLLVIEHLWAKGLKQAIKNAKGTLLDEGRIHPEAHKELEALGGN